MVTLMVSVIDILIYMTYVCVCVYAKKVNCLLCSILMDGTPDQLHIEQLLCEEECEEDGLFYYMLSTVAI